MIGRMDKLGLPDPGDYVVPQSGDQRHPSIASAASPPAGPAPAQTVSSGDPAAPAAPTPTPPEVSPYPPAPPSAAGVNVTESVYQQGA